jgi:O-acetylhomoserine (thiol)-lyase
LGLETLALRIGRSCENALRLARYLKSHAKVVGVNYPGLEGTPFHEIAAAQFPLGAGGILTFQLKDREECFRFMDRLKLVRRATNINDNKTLILHPSSTIYCEYTPEEKEKMGVGDNLIRLSVGIEDVEDLLGDLNDALESL